MLFAGWILLLLAFLFLGRYAFFSRSMWNLAFAAVFFVGAMMLTSACRRFRGTA